ncbi:MAG: hypothetical protein HRU30_08300 [Rhodobacteraceae bacterium]|nr:hypothetical protein [Paracoccaceae bacterium]
MTEITLTSDTLQASIQTRGATLTKFRWKETDTPLILEFSDPGDPIGRDVFAGVIVGPLANRVRTPLHVNSVEYDLGQPKDSVVLHGGESGLSNETWSIEAHTDTQVMLTIFRAHMSDGFPGDRRITVTYSLSGATMSVEIIATSTEPTAFAPAHHPYWTLGEPGGTKNMMLEVAADHVIPVDDRQLPTGEVMPVDATVFDHRTARTPDATLDHNFCLTQNQRPTPEFACRLSAANGMVLDIDTTEPGLQVYSGSGLPSLAPSRTNGPVCAPLAAMALEPQFWPNALEHPHFAQPLITSSYSFKQFSRYRLHSKHSP